MAGPGISGPTGSVVNTTTRVWVRFAAVGPTIAVRLPGGAVGKRGRK